MEQSTRNALAALETAGCDAPVYKGSADTIDGTVKTAFSVFGTDGMGDADLIHPKKQAEDGDAVDFIIDTVRNNPDEVEIIAIGPATNIAKAIKKSAGGYEESQENLVNGHSGSWSGQCFSRRGI